MSKRLNVFKRVNDVFPTWHAFFVTKYKHDSFLLKITRRRGSKQNFLSILVLFELSISYDENCCSSFRGRKRQSFSYGSVTNSGYNCHYVNWLHPWTKGRRQKRVAHH